MSSGTHQSHPKRGLLTVKVSTGLTRENAAAGQNKPSASIKSDQNSDSESFISSVASAGLRTPCITRQNKKPERLLTQASQDKHQEYEIQGRISTENDGENVHLVTDGEEIKCQKVAAYRGKPEVVTLPRFCTFSAEVQYSVSPASLKPTTPLLPSSTIVKKEAHQSTSKHSGTEHPSRAKENRGSHSAPLPRSGNSPKGPRIKGW